MSEAMMAAAKLYNDPRYFSPSEVRIRNNRIKRQRIVRRQIVFLTIAISILMFVIIFFTSSLMSDAQSDNYEPTFKYYKTITVHAGDTIWDIANSNYSSDHYNDISDYISEIQSINNISDNNIVNAGESLILPYYSTEYK